MKKSNKSLSDRDSKLLDISIIIPIYNEEENTEELYSRLSDVLKKLKKSYEILCVDDGSTDKSYQILKEIHQKDKRIKIIKFSRNFGHHTALTAGLNHCRGETVVMMDADLQDRPEDIPLLLQKTEQGYDIAYALREKHQSTFINKTTSKIFYKMLNKLTHVDVTQNAGTFRVMKRNVVDTLNKLNEASRFMPGLIDWTGFKKIGIGVDRNARSEGRKKYNFWKRLKLAVTATTSFSHFPVQIAGYIGFAVAGISFIYGIYIIIRKIFFGIPIAGYASLTLSILFFAGIQLIVLGFLGEYIGKIFKEVQNRPLYIIEEIIE